MNHWAWPRTFNVQMASEVRTSFIIWLIFQPCLIASTGELRNPESGIHRLAPMLGSSGSSNQSYNCIWWLLNVLPGVCWSSLGWSRGGLHCLVVVTTEQWELRPPCGIQTTILHNTPSIWEWCIPFIYSDLVDGLLLFCLHWWHIYIYSCCVCPSLPSLATSLRWRWRKHVVFQTCWNDQADTDVEGRMTTVRPSPSRGEYAIGEELNIFLLIGEYRVLY